MNSFFKIVFWLCMFITFVQCGSNNVNSEQNKIEKSRFIDERDGELYHTVKIGEQEWMSENLRYESANSMSYKNDSADDEVFGRLYLIEEAVNVCPSGWHLPDESDWDKLLKFSGNDTTTAGGKLKSTEMWQSPNAGATDEYGFNALPAGYYDVQMEEFRLRGKNATFWTLPVNDSTKSYYRSIYFDDAEIIRIQPYKEFAFSVRCVKDRDK